jgi:hypothetical protein
MPTPKSKPDLSLSMLRSFVAFSERLNLSHAMEDLGVTRQTIRRHITELETIRREKLFSTDTRGRYGLTKAGAQFLNDAKDILWHADASDPSNRLSLKTIDGCEHLTYRGKDGYTYYSQQHRLSALNTNGVPILKEMLRAWGASAAQLEHPEMRYIRPYLLVYRWSSDGWVCADVGEKSAYWRWRGPDFAQSIKGTLADDDEAGEPFIVLVSKAYPEIYHTGSIRYDHFYVRLPRAGYNNPQPGGFQRLLAGCVFPDGQHALAILAAITNRIEIDALSSDDFIPVDQMTIMDNEAFKHDVRYN